MAAPPLLTSGVPAFDELLDGVAIGDNLVLLVGDDTPIDWFVDACVRASDREQLVIVDTSGRHEPDAARAVLAWTDATTPAEEARAAVLLQSAARGARIRQGHRRQHPGTKI